MKKFCLLCLVLCLLCSGVCPVLAAPDGEFHWYCTKNKEGKQALCPPELAFVLEHGGYYIDRAHGDDNPDKVVYLTFDAGYENGNVQKILNILKETETKATFFLLSHFVEANADLVERMATEGHVIGNHTAHHKNLSHASREKIEEELKGLESALSAQGITCGSYFRPPEGSFSEELLKTVQSFGYRTVFWSFAYADWDNARQPEPRQSLEKLLTHTHNGEVLLLHPTSDTNAAILKEYIETLKAKGYRFATVEELCRER